MRLRGFRSQTTDEEVIWDGEFRVYDNSMCGLARPITDFINPLFSPEARAKIMAEMVRPATSMDGNGYIYALTLVGTLPGPSSPSIKHVAEPNSESSSSGHFILKVGRTGDVQTRVEQWQRQCKKDYRLMGSWPRPRGLAAQKVQNGRPKSERTWKYSARVERLVLLELEAWCELWDSHDPDASAGLGSSSACQGC